MTKVSQALYELKRTAANIDKECNELERDLDMLQVTLSSLDSESRLSETMSQADLMTVSETIKTSAVSLDELLSAIDRTKHPPPGLNRHIDTRSLSKVLATTQNTIRTQTELLNLLLSSRILQPRCAAGSVLTFSFLGPASYAATSYPQPIEQIQRDNTNGNLADCISCCEKENQRKGTTMSVIDNCSQATMQSTPLARYTEGGLIVAGAAGSAMMYIWDQYRNETSGDITPSDAHPTVNLNHVQNIVYQRMADMLFLRQEILNSPHTLIASIAFTTFAITAYHYRHRHERHQDALMISAAGGGAIVGRMLGLDGTSVLLKVVPGCILIALLLSTTIASWLARKPDFHGSDGDRNRKSVAFCAM